MAVNFDGSPVTGSPSPQTGQPVSYRAAYTFEPVKGLMFYSMFATAYDPAAAGIFSVSPANSLALTSAKIYETGVKQLFWDNRAEWTLAAYDITRNNVYVAISDTQSSTRRRSPHQGRRTGRCREADRGSEDLGQCRA